MPSVARGSEKIDTHIPHNGADETGHRSAVLPGNEDEHLLRLRQARLDPAECLRIHSRIEILAGHHLTVEKEELLKQLVARAFGNGKAVTLGAI